MTIRVIVNGAHGKMGQIAVKAVNDDPELVLVNQIGRQNDLTQAIRDYKAEVVIDFTVPETVYSNAQTIFNSGARPVIGTTGLTSEQIKILSEIAAEKNLGAIIAPNFSLGAVLMMRYAQDAAQFLPDYEIIEMHHPQKLDAPSGTAIKTAHMMNASSSKNPSVNTQAPARGENREGVQIHSLRLPGFYSHQTIVFGSTGEVLTICHQGIDRQCCIPGIALACKKVISLNKLVYGLDKIMFEI